MADRDVEQARADLEAAEAKHELTERQAREVAADIAAHGLPTREQMIGWLSWAEEMDVGRFGHGYAARLLDAYAGAQVAAERERIAAAIQARYSPIRPLDGTYDEPAEPTEWDEALYEAARIARGAP